MFLKLFLSYFYSYLYYLETVLNLFWALQKYWNCFIYFKRIFKYFKTFFFKALKTG